MDLRLDRGAGDAEAQGHVAGLVLGDRTHPAVVSVGRVGALLEEARVAGRVQAKLGPSHPGAPPSRDRTADPQPTVAVGEIAGPRLATGAAARECSAPTSR